MQQLIPLLFSSAPLGEPFILLLAPFAILGILDIIGLERIDLRYVLLFSAFFIAVFLYNIRLDISGYLAASTSYALLETFGSMAILLLLPGLGTGDKLVVASTFLVFPFWLIWAIVLLALLLTRPVFKIMSIFIRKGAMALPFYPFLFISSLLVFALLFIVL